MGPHSWDVTNRVLYALCAEHPCHERGDEGAVLAKILLIGRAYAAAIERRRDKKTENDQSYDRDVVPALIKSRLDKWISEACAINPHGKDALRVATKAHGNTVQLFAGISAINNRSLASKYLHFHVPALFCIYDARAVKGMGALTSIVGRASRDVGAGADKSYYQFTAKCIKLRDYCKDEFGLSLSPRQIDNLLLACSDRRI